MNPDANQNIQWPNIEIFFFHSDESYIWSITPTGFNDILCNNKFEVFPLVMKQFEEWQVPMPRKAASLLGNQFGHYSTECVAGGFNQKSNRVYPREVILCDALYELYTFLFPGQLEDAMKNSGKIIKLESLKGGPLYNPMGKT